MVQICGRTDVGRRRHRNEDSILVGDGMLVVCDGMGGHQAGDVASRIGVDTIAGFISRSGADPDLTWPYGFDPSLSFNANRIRTAIKLANRAIFTRAAATSARSCFDTSDEPADREISDPRAHRPRRHEQRLQGA